MKFSILVLVLFSSYLSAESKALKALSVTLKFPYAGAPGVKISGRRLPSEGQVLVYLPPPRQGLSKMSCFFNVALEWRGPFDGIENQLDAMAAKMRLQLENKITQTLLKDSAAKNLGPEIKRSINVTADFFRVQTNETAALFLVRLKDFAGTFVHRPVVKGAAIPQGETAFVNDAGIGLSVIDPGTTPTPLSVKIAFPAPDEALKKSQCGPLLDGSFEVQP